MNAVETYIKIAERFSTYLQLKSTEGRSDDAEAVLASKSERFKIRNELDAATAATVDALKRAGVDATPVQRTTNAAWHYVGRFQDEWFACKAILQTFDSSELGVSLSDVGLAIGNCDKELKDFVCRFSKSKKITAEKLGKCPNDSRANLYRLFEIVKNLHDFSPLSEAEKQRITKQLSQLQRKPAKAE